MVWQKTWTFVCDLRPRGKRWILTRLKIDMDAGTVTETFEESETGPARPVIVYVMTI